MIAPMTINDLEAVANELGFVLARHIVCRDIGVDASYANAATQDGRLRLGNDPRRIPGDFTFEGTPRECAAFLIGWRDRDAAIRAWRIT